MEYWRRCLQVLFESLSKGSLVVEYWRRCLQVLFESLSKGSPRERTFGERFKEHLKTPSPIFHHQNISGHITSMDNFKILGREENNMARTIQEAMFIRVNNPTLNKNIGKFNLPHIWDRILFTIPELKLKK